MSIRVGDIVISEHEINTEVQYHPAPSLDAAKREAVRALVVRALLLQEARHRGLVEGDGAAAEEHGLRALTEQAVAVPDVSDAECRAYFEDNRDRFRGPDLFAPSHILFAARPDDIEGRIEAKQNAEATLAELQERPERFQRIAQAKSGCPSGATGGALGQIQRGETLGEFERALRTTEPGCLHPQVIETDHGFHVLKLDARVEGDLLPFESVSDRIRIYLRDRAWRVALQGFIGALASKAVVEGFDLTIERPAGELN